MAETLNFGISYGVRLQVQPDVRTVKFDEGGYELRSSRGLNSVLEVWEVPFDAVPISGADALEAFFARHQGVSWFYWQAPRRTGVRKYVCQQWTREPVSRTHDRLSAVFKEVVNLV